MTRSRRLIAAVLLALTSCGKQQQPPVKPAPVLSAPRASVNRLPAIELAPSLTMPPRIIFTSDVSEVSSLVAALQRRPVTAAPGELSISLTGGRSANKERRAAEVLELPHARLLAGVRFRQTQHKEENACGYQRIGQEVGPHHPRAGDRPHQRRTGPV